MSAQEQIRAMLDELMGTSRDGDAHRQRVRFDDPRVCKSFLLGCCPHEILSSTRMDLGECPKYHDLALKADYEIASKNKDYFYDIDALEHLENFIAECDRKVDLAKRRLKETQEELSEEAASKAEMIHGLGEHIGTNLAKAEEVGAEGDVEASLKLMAEIEDLKKIKAQAEIDYRNSMPASSYQQQKLRVCEVCSAYLGIHDNDRRLADHFGGKLHLGFITIRQKLDDLKKTVQDRRAQRERDREDRRKELDRKDPPPSASKSRDRVQHTGRSRDPVRSRSKERVRSKSKERARSRSRERRRRSGSRHHRRSRSRSGGRRRRSRSRSRDRRRKRSRTRSRSRSRRSRSRSKSRRSRKSTRRSRSRSRSRRSDSKSKRSRRSHSGSRRKSRSRSRDRRSRDKSREKSSDKSRDKSRERSRETSREKCSSKDIESERRNGDGSIVPETDSTAVDQVASVDSTSLNSFQVTAE